MITYDTRISMADGTWSNNVQIDNQVLSFQTITGLSSKKQNEYNLRPVSRGKVLKTYYAANKPIIEISTRNRKVRTSENHQFVRIVEVPSINGTNYNIAQWCAAGDLQAGDIVGVMKEHVEYRKSQTLNLTQTFGSKANFKDILRLCGFYTGDGYARYRLGEGGETALYTFNDEHTKLYGDIVKHNFGIEPHYVNNKSGTFIIFYSVKLATLIDNIGLKGYSQTKRIPRWIFQIPRELQRSYIDGYADADGHIRARGNEYNLEAANEDLICDFHTLGMNLGMGTSNISEKDREVETKGVLHVLN